MAKGKGYPDHVKNTDKGFIWRMKSKMQQVNMGAAVKNDLWITDSEEMPDPKPLPELPGFNILIRPVSVKSVTKGGIFIPDSTKDDMSYLTTVGQVLGLGTLAYMDKDKFPTGAWCNVGDYQVIMKVEDPKDLDPTFNLGKGSS